MFLLNAALESGSATNYLPIGIQLIFAILFVGMMMGLTHFFGPKRDTADKLANFESGIEAVGNARQPMAVKYFLPYTLLSYQYNKTLHHVTDTLA